MSRKYITLYAAFFFSFLILSGMLLGMQFQVFLMGSLFVTGMIQLLMFTLKKKHIRTLFTAMICFAAMLWIAFLHPRILDVVFPGSNLDLPEKMGLLLTVLLGITGSCHVCFTHPAVWLFKCLGIFILASCFLASLAILLPRSALYAVENAYGILLLAFIIPCLLGFLQATAAHGRSCGIWLLAVLVLHGAACLCRGLFDDIRACIWFPFILFETLGVLLKPEATLPVMDVPDIFHEFRTPLYSIIGLTESLLVNQTSNLERAQLDKLTLITDKGFYLAGLITQCQNLSTKHIKGGIPIKPGKIIDPLKYTILINDDDPINLMILNEQISSVGYKTITASCGKDLLCIINGSELQIDLIILDILLPDISGYGLCSEIRKKYSRRELPIIFLSATVHEKEIQHCLSIGANTFLVKPVSKGDLLAQILVHLPLKKKRGGCEYAGK